MTKKKVLVSGCNGYMGQIVCRLIEQSEEFEVQCGFDKTVSEEPKNFRVSSILDYIFDVDTPTPDIIIDFSSPEATMELLKFAKEFKIPTVIATTGFTKEQEEKILETANTVPIFKSSNMESNIALLKNTVRMLAPYLADCDIEILETHHNRKKDAPSGTALLLANAIKEALEDSEKKIVYGRTEKRNQNEIGISSLRGGNIVGEHTIFFYGKYETIELKHTAYSREGFAEGALNAARFLLARFLLEEAPRLYTMDDMIKM